MGKFATSTEQELRRCLLECTLGGLAREFGTGFEEDDGWKHGDDVGGGKDADAGVAP